MTSIDPTDRFQVENKGSRKWFVFDRLAPIDADDDGAVDGPFKTRHLAEESARQLNFDNPIDEPDEDSPEPQSDPVRVQALVEVIEAAVAAKEAQLVDVDVNLDKTPEPDPVVEADAVAPATIPAKERMALALAEHRAVQAWKAQVPRIAGYPATPVLDWMADPANAKPAAAPKAERKTVDHTPEQLSDIRFTIEQGREAGLSWAKIAKDIETLGIPTARGGKWYDTTASDLAKKLGITGTQPADEAHPAPSGHVAA